jgi:hypothetical protein
MKLTKIALIFVVEFAILHQFLPESVTQQSALLDLYSFVRQVILG